MAISGSTIGSTAVTSQRSLVTGVTITSSRTGVADLGIAIGITMEETLVACKCKPIKAVSLVLLTEITVLPPVCKY